MKISIFGLGYVGSVTAACLASKGNEVCGVDINRDKVDMINTGRSPIIEPGLEAMIAEGCSKGLLRATTNAADSLRQTELSIICVSTPCGPNGSLDLTVATKVCQQIGKALGLKKDHHCLVFRSTVLPGTVRHTLIPLLNEASGKSANEHFDVCFNPEFLREGSSIADFFAPPLTVIGCENLRAAEMVRMLYSPINGPVFQTSYEVAEMLKYACNSFHALKVVFANEIGALCRSFGIDSHMVMEMFVRDDKLNISPYYLRPGFAYGGSCLPKDLRALIYRAKQCDTEIPLLSSIPESNRRHIERAISQVLCKNKKRVGVIGLSFKAGTDDLRESPIVTLIETLIGKGLQVKIYDPEVSIARLIGANKGYIEQEIPHISSLIRPRIHEIVDTSEILIIAKQDPAISELRADQLHGKTIVDLVRSHFRDDQIAGCQYEGVCW